MAKQNYQIWICKKGDIEIFQNVFRHNTIVVDGALSSIIIWYVGQKDGPVQKSLDGIYELKMVMSPFHDWVDERPKNIKITFHG